MSAGEKRSPEPLDPSKRSKSNGITEHDVGITAYVAADLPGFRGLLKQRYTDFQVNEIDQSSIVAHLTDLGRDEEEKDDKKHDFGEDLTSTEAPEASSESSDSNNQSKHKTNKFESKTNFQETSKNQQEAVESSQEMGNGDKKQNAAPEIVLEETHRLELDEALGSEFVGDCIKLASKTLDKPQITTEKIFPDKASRTRIHQLFREAFRGKLATKTTAENNLVVESSTPSRSRKRGIAAKKAGNTLEYLHMTLYKENRDTMEAVSMLSRLLRVPSRALSFAGTKDRRAVTAQRICLHRGTVGRMISLNSALPETVRIGNFKYETWPLRLGDLSGNEFWIAVRDVEAGDMDRVAAALTSLRDRGFVNYFGLQRFGTFSVSSHTLGRLILNGDYDGAVAGILAPQDLTSDISRDARTKWAETGDVAATLDLMPRRCVAECAVLEALKQSSSALNALLRIPRNLKTMYIHAYQSYVWNCAASERVKMGLNVLPGDFIIDGTTTKASGVGEIPKARLVTEEDIENGSISIYDVVLPTPGWDVQYPESLKNIYWSIMQNDGIDPSKLQHRIREFSLAGTYRSLLTKPNYVEWWTPTYNDAEQALIRTDKELLSQPGEAKVVDTKGPYNAIVLRMALGPSQYATMALREAMKVDTGRHGGLYFAECR